MNYGKADAVQAIIYNRYINFAICKNASLQYSSNHFKDQQAPIIPHLAANKSIIFWEYPDNNNLVVAVLFFAIIAKDELITKRGFYDT